VFIAERLEQISMKQTFDEMIIGQAEKTLTLSQRTIGKLLVVLLFFLVVPLCGLAYFLISSGRSGVTYDNTLFFFWFGFAYFSTTWHLMPTRYWEIVIYSLLICVVSSVSYVWQNNINIGNGGGEISLLLYSPWIQIFVISILYFPVKSGFDSSVRERPIQEDEEGLYSQNTIMRYLQMHYDVPSFRPRVILLGVFTTIFAILLFFNGMWNWLSEIRISI